MLDTSRSHSLRLTPNLTGPLWGATLKMFHLKHVLNFALIVGFMISAIVNIQKFLQKNTVVVESERSTLEVTLPSFTMCPWYNFDLGFSKSSKNLTELYESLLSAAQIKKDIKNISQPYFAKNE